MKKQKALNSIITGVSDGRESNSYIEMQNVLYFLLENKMIKANDTFSVKQLQQALKIASSRQEKAIDEYLKL
jgi:hypothetical protein